jgi:hypothetical protein
MGAMEGLGACMARSVAQEIADLDVILKKTEAAQKVLKAKLAEYGPAKYDVEGHVVAVESTEKVEITDDLCSFLRDKYPSEWRRNRVTSIPVKAVRALMELHKAIARRVSLVPGVRVSVRKAKKN